MKRLGSLAVLLTMLVFGAGTAAATAGSGSIHLKAPSSISASKQFSVTASGTAPSHGTQYVFVLFTKDSSCAGTIGAASGRGDTIIHFGNKNGAQVHGHYSVKTNKVHGGSAGSGHLCGYLYAGSQHVDSKPEAHASRAITFTG
jgi:hypothetical protein